MSYEKIALGLHPEKDSIRIRDKSIVGLLSYFGTVEVFRDSDEYLEVARKKEHDLYVFEANLGKPNGEDPTFSLAIRDFLEGERDYVGISGNPNFIQMLISKRVRAIEKSFSRDELLIRASTPVN